MAVAELGGADIPLSPFFSFSCSFRQELCPIGRRSPLGSPPPGKSWISHCRGLYRVLADMYVTIVQHQVFSDLSNATRQREGVVIIFRMSSIRIYPSLSLYSIIYPNWFLLLFIFTARNSSFEKVMLSQACVSSQRVGIVGPMSFLGVDISGLKSLPGDEYVQGDGHVGGGGVFMIRAGYVYPP